MGNSRGTKAYLVIHRRNPQYLKVEDGWSRLNKCRDETELNETYLGFQFKALATVHNCSRSFKPLSPPPFYYLSDSTVMLRTLRRSLGVPWGS
jgi:hypothetical protein